jgi:hypothetical protein
MYLGEAFNNNEWHQSRHQPIIDRELWESFQEKD